MRGTPTMTESTHNPSARKATRRIPRTISRALLLRSFVNALTCISRTYSRVSRLTLYDRAVPETTRLEDTLVRGYRQLALETPHRPKDATLRALDIVFAAV